MGAGRPMDRLVCGDVGFGKTEVALRAAFVAAMNGKQVAVVVPTTLLARQHYKTFCERFRGLPLNIAQASRFVPAAEMKKAKEGLDGRVASTSSSAPMRCSARRSSSRISASIVVDEEQHFGVSHKERLKELRAEVHVLTLSATPIPRTLQLALTGVRELSLIATPPVDRLAVRTFITPFDPLLDPRGAAARALSRRPGLLRRARASTTSPRSKAFLDKEVPEAKVAVAHGQMAAGELEDIMTAFYDGKYDVLLSTTIVESGLDIPDRQHADRPPRRHVRPAQLYQLRGRVGRSKTRAYALFTVPANKPLTAQAERRLKVLQIARHARAPASSSPATISTSAAPATCSARSSPATSRKSATSSTSRCCEEAVAQLKARRSRSRRRTSGRRRSRSARR